METWTISDYPFYIHATNALGTYVYSSMKTYRVTCIETSVTISEDPNFPAGYAEEQVVPANSTTDTIFLNPFNVLNQTLICPITDVYIVDENNVLAAESTHFDLPVC